MEPTSVVILANFPASQSVKDSTQWPWQLATQLFPDGNLSSLHVKLKLITPDFSPGCCLLKKSAQYSLPEEI